VGEGFWFLAGSNMQCGRLTVEKRLVDRTITRIVQDFERAAFVDIPITITPSSMFRGPKTTVRWHALASNSFRAPKMWTLIVLT